MMFRDPRWCEPPGRPVEPPDVAALRLEAERLCEREAEDFGDDNENATDMFVHLVERSHRSDITLASVDAARKALDGHTAQQRRPW